MCNKAVSCSVFKKSQCPQKKKIEKKRKQSPKTAPWLRTPEPPITKEKGKREKKWEHHGPKEETTIPERVPEKTSDKVPDPDQLSLYPNPSQQNPSKLQNRAKAPATLLKHSRSHPPRALNPPPPPGGHGPRAHAEGTWPSTAGHREGGSPSSSGRCRG